MGRVAWTCVPQPLCDTSVPHVRAQPGCHYDSGVRSGAASLLCFLESHPNTAATTEGPVDLPLKDWLFGLRAWAKLRPANAGFGFHRILIAVHHMTRVCLWSYSLVGHTGAPF